MIFILQYNYLVMKTIFSTLLTIILIFLFECSATAQQYTSIQYVIASPMNNLKDYINKTSFRGATFEYQTKINTNIAAGIALGWNVFYERKPYATYYDGTASLSGIQYRYTSSVPIHITGIYLLNEESRFNPFLGMGIGTTYTVRNTDMGLYRWEEDTWSFSIRPEVGFMYTIRKTTGVKAALRYNAAFKTSDLKDQSFFSLSVGLVSIK